MHVRLLVIVCLRDN